MKFNPDNQIGSVDKNYFKKSLKKVSFFPGCCEFARWRRLAFSSRRPCHRRLHHRPLHLLRPRVLGARQQRLESDDGTISRSLSETALHFDSWEKDRSFCPRSEHSSDHRFLWIHPKCRVDRSSF